MRTFTKKQIYNLLAALIGYALFFAALAFLIDQDRSTKDFISAPALTNWKIASIFLVLLSFLDLWRLDRRLLARINSQSKQGRLLGISVSPEAAVLFICYGLLIFPDICGMVLFFWGMPLTEIFYFEAASIVEGLIWGFYYLRKSQA